MFDSDLQAMARHIVESSVHISTRYMGNEHDSFGPADCTFYANGTIAINAPSKELELTGLFDAFQTIGRQYPGREQFVIASVKAFSITLSGSDTQYYPLLPSVIESDLIIENTRLNSLAGLPKIVKNGIVKFRNCRSLTHLAGLPTVDPKNYGYSFDNTGLVSLVKLPPCLTLRLNENRSLKTVRHLPKTIEYLNISGHFTASLIDVFDRAVRNNLNCDGSAIPTYFHECVEKSDKIGVTAAKREFIKQAWLNGDKHLASLREPEVLRDGVFR